MKHKAKSFIAVLLALCLMMSLGIGALADMSGPEPRDGNQPSGVQPDGDKDTGGDDPEQPVGDTEDPGNPGHGDIPGVTADNCTIYFGVDTNIVNTNVTYISGEETISVSSGKTVPKGTELTINATSNNPDYRIGTIQTSSTQDGTKTNLSGDKLKVIGDTYIWFNYVQLYDIKCQTASNGTVVASPTKAAEGDSVTITASPNEGFEVESITYTPDGETAQTITGDSFVMPASDVTVTATFKQTEQPEPDPPKTYTVTYLASPYYNVAGLQRSYEADADVTFSVTPVTNYSITSVSSTDVDITNKGNGSYSFTMPEAEVNINITCRYTGPMTGEYNIDTYSNSAYSGVALITGDTAKWGDTVKFRIYDAYRYDYYNVYVYTKSGDRIYPNYNATYDYYSFSMPDDDVTISVYFDYVGTYSITKDVEGDGSIYVRSSADHGDTVWIEAAPSAGQSLTSLRVFYGEPWAYGDKGYYGYWDEADVHYSEYWDAYYFTMPADDVVVYARFTDGATVDVIAGDHGDAKVSSRYAEKGDWVYITAYPDEGYEVDSVTVTDSLGRSVKVTELSYDYFLFTMPGTNVDVKVTFRVKDYDVFYDVSRGDWYYKAVRFVHEKGIMEGTGTHYFSPEADLSRGMLATILYRLEGSPSVSGYSGFSDVADTAYYAKAVAWAKANGIVNGVTATAYEPDTAVTREELAAILCRYAAFKGKDTAISYDYLAGFSDANTSHVYARPALNWAVAYDIINGQGNGVLAPRATATRAEVAQVLMNYLEVFD